MFQICAQAFDILLPKHSQFTISAQIIILAVLAVAMLLVQAMIVQLISRMLADAIVHISGTAVIPQATFVKVSKALLPHGLSSYSMLKIPKGKNGEKRRKGEKGIYSYSCQ